MAAAAQRIFKPGQYLFREGDMSNCMYLVKRGTVSVRKGREGNYVEISKIHSNEVLGELSFFDRRPRSAAALAISEVEVVEISFEALDKIYANVPDYLKTIMASVAERMRKANDLIRKLKKELGTEEKEDGEAPKEEEDAASVLAATADVPEDPEKKS